MKKFTPKKSKTNSKVGGSYVSPKFLKKIKKKRIPQIGCSDDTFYPS